MFFEKYSSVRLALILSIILSLAYISKNVASEQDIKRKQYERYVDSLYQINIKIAMDYGKALDTNPNAIRPEPAIWFLDMDGNMYDYPPIEENDSIMREREAYKRRLDSLGGRQFKEIEEWYKNKHKK